MSSELPWIVSWLAKRNNVLRQLLWHGHHVEAVNTILTMLTADSTRRCPIRLHFCTDNDSIIVQVLVYDLLTELGKERSMKVWPRYFDSTKEALWQWLCEHDKLADRHFTFAYDMTAVVLDNLSETIKDGRALLNCRICNKVGLRADYFEKSSGYGWVNTQSQFRCSSCKQEFFHRNEDVHYSYPER
jgi:hypothetical protein